MRCGTTTRGDGLRYASCEETSSLTRGLEWIRSMRVQVGVAEEAFVDRVDRRRFDKDC